MSMLVIDDNVREKAKLVKQAALSHRIPFDDLKRRVSSPGAAPFGDEFPDLAMLIPVGVSVVFTFEEQDPEKLGWTRHISISAGLGKTLPYPCVNEILALFDFEMRFPNEPGYSKKFSLYVEDAVNALNIIEEVNIGESKVFKLDGGGFKMFTIYDHPADFPNHFAIREWIISGAEPIASPNVSLTDTLELARTQLQSMGLARIARSPGDDSLIVETWM